MKLLFWRFTDLHLLFCLDGMSIKQKKWTSIDCCVKFLLGVSNHHSLYNFSDFLEKMFVTSLMPAIFSASKPFLHTLCFTHNQMFSFGKRQGSFGAVSTQDLVGHIFWLSIEHCIDNLVCLTVSSQHKTFSGVESVAMIMNVLAGWFFPSDYLKWRYFCSNLVSILSHNTIGEDEIQHAYSGWSRAGSFQHCTAFPKLSPNGTQHLKPKSDFYRKTPSLPRKLTWWCRPQTLKIHFRQQKASRL